MELVTLCDRRPLQIAAIAGILAVQAADKPGLLDSPEPWKDLLHDVPKTTRDAVDNDIRNYMSATGAYTLSLLRLPAGPKDVLRSLCLFPPVHPVPTAAVYQLWLAEDSTRSRNVFEGYVRTLIKSSLVKSDTKRSVCVKHPTGAVPLVLYCVKFC